MRPADRLFPDRIKALEEQRCVAPPMGCGKPLTTFRDPLSKREYEITRLCQECQDKFFTEE